MRREVKFVMNEEEITCITDIRKAKDTINRTMLNIDRLDKKEIAEILKATNERLTIALKKLELEIN